MTPEIVKKLIARADANQIVMGFRGLDEKARKRVASTVAQIRKELRALDIHAHRHQTAPFLREYATKTCPASLEKQHLAADLCAFAACSITEVKRIEDWRLSQLDEQALLRILCDRKPAWLDAWLETWVSQEWANPAWPTFLGLIEDAEAAVPQVDGLAEYLVQAMYDHHPSLGTHFDGVPLADRITSSPIVLEHLWRIFEVETHAFKHDYYLGSGKARWPEALVELSERGVLDRGRLLDESLAALSVGFPRNMVSGLARFHAALDPTSSERLERQDQYIGLLGGLPGGVDAVVSGLALRMLKPVAEEEGFDLAAFAASARGVFNERIKRNAMDVLGLARKLGRVEERRATLLPLAVGALRHPHEDVQERGIGLLESWAPAIAAGDGADLANEIRGCAPGVSATLRERVAQLVAMLSGENGPVLGDEGEEFDTEDMLRRASDIPEAVARVTGLDEARAALETGRVPGPLGFGVLDAPMLASAVPIEPIGSVDELFDAVAHIVEVVDSADELERVLDGIARLCADETADFGRRAEPILKRILRLVTTFGLVAAGSDPPLIRYVDQISWLRVLVAWLNSGWIEDEAVDESTKSSRFGFQTLRMRELAERVRLRQAGPLLSAPTHGGGWIDPVRFVDRIGELARGGHSPDRLDLIAGLLRLAPDRRNAALARAASVPGDVGAAVRFALGGKAPDAELKDGPLWLAAKRSRQPKGDDEGFEKAQPRVDTANGARGAESWWRARVWTHGHTSLDVRTRIIPDETAVHDRPTDIMGSYLGRMDVCDRTWEVRWLASTWPLNPDPDLGAGAHFLSRRIDDPASNFCPNHAHLEPLFHPDMPWSEMACLAVWLGLVSLDRDSRGTAIDAMIEGIEDGRVHAEPMGAVIARLNVPGWLKLNRVSESLREVARVSDLHAWVVCGCLDALVASCQSTPRDLHHVLTLYHELLVGLGQEASEVAKVFLASVDGSGKAAQLAKRIGSLTAARGTDGIAARVLEQRLVRAERWCEAREVNTSSDSAT